MITRLTIYSLVGVFSGYLFAATAAAQPASQRATPGATVRTVLASTALPTVVDAPRYFRAVRVNVSVQQATTYTGAVGFVFALTGSLEVRSGADPQVLEAGDATLIGAGTNTILRARGDQPADFVHIVLLTADELRKPMHARPATVSELYTTASPIPGLKPGPHEFSLVRVTIPPRAPMNPPHRRSGAALYYIYTGTGLFAAESKTEPKPAGLAHYEPYYLVHQWANPGDVPLVLIQANISLEGVPAVIFVKDGDASGAK